MRTFRFQSILVLFAALTCGGFVANAQNLVQNGSFETPATTTIVTLPAGNTGLTPWTILSGNVDVTTSGGNPAPKAGARLLDISGTAPGAIEQTLTTVAGQAYKLSFYMSGSPNSAPLTKQVEVRVAGALQTFTYDSTGATARWELKELSFTATASSTALRFTSVQNTGSPFGAYLDDVVVVAATVITFPSATTNAATLVTATSAQLNATVNPNGSSTSAYFGYGPTANYTSTTPMVGVGSGTSSQEFSATLTGLLPNTTYHFGVVARNAATQVTSGLDQTFTTPAAATAPRVATVSVASVGATSAIIAGNVTSDGGAIVTERGVLYGRRDLAGLNQTVVSSTTGTGNFTVSLSNLSPSAPYYAQAFATNSAGTTFGDSINFTTLSKINLPTVTTGEATNIGATSATVSGAVSADGGATVTQRGVVYKTTQDPTASRGTLLTSGAGTGSFTVDFKSGQLKSDTTYLVQAFATNSVGTSYGNQITFKTLPGANSKLQRVVTLQPTTKLNDGTTYTATFSASVNPMGSPTSLYYRIGTSLDVNNHPVGGFVSTGTEIQHNATLNGATSRTVFTPEVKLKFKLGEKYYVQARAESLGETSWGGYVDFTPGAPPVANQKQNGRNVQRDSDKDVIAEVQTDLSNEIPKLLGWTVILASLDAGWSFGPTGLVRLFHSNSTLSRSINGRNVAAASEPLYNLTTSFNNGLLSGTITGPGISTITFNCKPDVAGPTASLAGLYSTKSLDGNTQIRTIVGGSGNAYSLITTSAGTEVATSVVDAYGNLSATTAKGTAINLGLSNYGVTGNLLASDGSQVVSLVGTASSSTAPGKLSNLSARAFIQGAQSPLVAGVVTNGTLSKSLLIRGVGPGLAGFGLSNYLSSPQLTLYDSKSAVLSVSTTWSSALAPTFSRLGAFALSSGSSDTATLVTLPTGGFTAQIASGSSSGVAIAEIYDADSSTSASRLINLSARGFVGSSSQALVAGLVIGGSASETLLVRAVGPGLGSFGLGGVCPSPVLTVFNSSGAVIASNAGWGNSIVPSLGAVSSGPSATTIQPATAGVFSSVGAFALANGSADSAMVLTLPPGSYTLQVTPATTAGVGLVEVYELP